MNAPYVWHHPQWQQWCRNMRAARLGHAWLLSGRDGFGKLEFARAAAELLLCEAPLKRDGACGQCRSCHLLQAGHHPDLRFVAPLEDATSISIEQIREFNDFFSLTAHYGQAKVVIIRPAELMQRAAANALLKILEEPPSLGILLLVANAIDRLTPTIRSRCQRLRLDVIDLAVAREWLTQVSRCEPDALEIAFRLGARAPLAARAALEDGLPEVAARVAQQMISVGSGRTHAVQAAQSFQDIAPRVQVDLMLGHAHQLALARAGVAGHSSALEPASSAVSLIGALDHLHSSDVLGFTAMALDIKGLIVGTANTRDLDLIDQLWRAWMQATRPAGTSATRATA